MSCLANGGTGSSTYNEYSDFTEAIENIDHVREEVCLQPTLSPTHKPIVSPTDVTTHNPVPWQSPTDNPIAAPTSSPTN